MEAVKMFNLELQKLEKSFLESLRTIKVELSQEAVCNISDNVIELGILAPKEKQEKGYKILFGSEIDLYCANKSILRNKENTINFGTSGSFTPNDKSSYWRIVHAYSVLKKWNKVSETVNSHCKMYSELFDNYKNQ